MSYVIYKSIAGVKSMRIKSINAVYMFDASYSISGRGEARPSRSRAGLGRPPFHLHTRM